MARLPVASITVSRSLAAKNIFLPCLPDFSFVFPFGRFHEAATLQHQSSAQSDDCMFDCCRKCCDAFSEQVPYFIDTLATALKTVTNLSIYVTSAADVRIRGH